MIGKGKSIAHTGNAIGYAEHKLDAEEIDRKYLIGQTPAEITREFGLVHSLNDNCQNNTFAFVISPTVEEGKQLTKQDWKEINKEFLEKMGLQEHQSVSYLHKDREHQHLHIYVNRIDIAEGKAFDDSFISNKASQAANEIAQARGLTTARDIQQAKVMEKTNEKEKVLGAHRDVMNIGPYDVGEYINLMKDHHKIDTRLRHDSKGKLVGVTYQLENGQKIKGSEVYHKLSGSKLEKTIQDNYKAIQQEKAKQQQRQQTITRSRDRDHGMSL